MLEEWVSVLIGLGWNNPLTAFGEFSMPVLATNIISFLGFLFAGIFVLLYTKKFYEGRDIPKSWKFFYTGLLLTALLQILEIPTMYRWIYGSLYFSAFILFQSAVVLILLYGTYLLFKELV